ncbi:MAG: FtsX-like permease family protein [Acidobacteriota bacterium]
MKHQGSLVARMAAEGRIAARYLRSGRRDASIRFLSRMTAAGIGLGVAALILAMAVLAGMQSRLLDDARRRTPDLQVLVDQASAEEAAALAERVRSSGTVADVRLLRTGLGWLRVGDSLEPLEIVGFEGPMPSWMPDANVAVDRLDGVVLPRRLVRRLGLSPGSSVELVSPRQRLGPLGPQPSTSYQSVLGSYDGGQDEARRQQAAVSLSVALRLFGSRGRILDVTPATGFSESEVVESVREIVGEAGLVQRWQDRNRGLLFVLRLEKALVFVAVALIVLVASFALVSAVSMIVANKRAEIGILGTMGLSPRRVRRLFTALGGLLAASGAAGGCLIAVPLALVLDAFEVIGLPGGIYIVDYLPFLVRPAEVGFVLACTFAFTSVASFLAARRASELDPIEALRK